MRIIHSNNPDLLAVQESVRDEIESLRREITGRRAGLTTRVISSDSGVTFGQIVRADTTNGAMSIFLPKITQGDVGKTLMIVNDSDSDNSITVHSAPPDTVEGVGNITMTGARSRMTICALAAGRWALIGDTTITMTNYYADRILLFSDDTELTETSTSYVTKKTFRMVVDSDKVPAKWRFVFTAWAVQATSGDTAAVEISVGSDSSSLTTISPGTETVYTMDVPSSGEQTTAGGTIATVALKLKVVGAGGATAHLKYSDMFAVFE